jgi:uncharacterized repeat protein (TIGR03803 family)
MKFSRQCCRLVLMLATFIVIVMLGARANARDRAYEVIWHFQDYDSWNPRSVAAAANGDLYGVTVDGGAYGWGTVFKLTAPRTRSGAWMKTVLYNFPSDNQEFPTSLIVDKDGTLYGAGGGPDTYGFIFRMTPPASHKKTWKYTVLYTLTDPSDGSAIQGNLVLDAEGNLYGATEQRGNLECECGTVFELKRPTKNGRKWRFRVLYRFKGTSDGREPFAGVAFDQSGNLYGTTWEGGAFDWGALYRLRPPLKKGRGWTETVLYSFSPSNDGIISPEGPVVLDNSGNIYGTTPVGGDLNCSGGFGCGVVYELSPPAKDGKAWIYATLYAFQGGNDGASPDGYMVFDSKGTLYGTTEAGGAGGGGTAYRMSPPQEGGGAWTETVLHGFTPNNGDGAVPGFGLTWGKWHDLYGVTYAGGLCGSCGTAFELRP